MTDTIVHAPIVCGCGTNLARTGYHHIWPWGQVSDVLSWDQPLIFGNTEKGEAVRLVDPTSRDVVHVCTTRQWAKGARIHLEQLA